jgi:two-component system, chemotaxis family, sensor kinase CheA
VGPNAVPDAIIARFRSVGLERLEQIESIWLSITQSPANAESGKELLRLLHTLKGDARIVGFVDVHFLCHKLEGLCAYADRHGYRVTDDFDLIVTMGVRFLAMLLRKKAGRSLGGIDLPGFARQIDEALLDAQLQDQLVEEQRRASRTVPTTPPRAVSVDRLSESTLNALCAAATVVYLELLCAEGPSRARLTEAWRELSARLDSLASVPLLGRVGRHAGAVSQLARDLGKDVEVVFELDDVRVSEEIAHGFDLIVLHGTRNAVDHGIEEPAARAAAGKPARASIRVAVSRDHDRIQLLIADDGRGVDRDAIRRRARDRGLLADDALQAASDEQLFALLFTPDFSTRDVVGPVSGRGVGLDAVKTTATELGGDVHVESEAGRGTTIVVDVPYRGTLVEAHVFAASARGILLAISADWNVSEHRGSERGRDPLHVLDVGGGQSEPPGGTVLEVRRGNQVGFVRAGGPSRRHLVERRCPTDAGRLLEIVYVGDSEVLLIRPEVLFASEGTAARA